MNLFSWTSNVYSEVNNARTAAVKQRSHTSNAILDARTTRGQTSIAYLF